MTRSNNTTTFWGFFPQKRWTFVGTFLDLLYFLRLFKAPYLVSLDLEFRVAPLTMPPPLSISGELTKHTYMERNDLAGLCLLKFIPLPQDQLVFPMENNTHVEWNCGTPHFKKPAFLGVGYGWYMGWFSIASVRQRRKTFAVHIPYFALITRYGLQWQQLGVSETWKP